MRILIADGRRDAALTLTQLLSTLVDEHVTVAVALDGAQAVEAAQAGRPNAVLVDIAMPGMGGLRAAHRVRQLYGRQAVIAAMSEEAGHLVSALDSGDFDYAFRKPMSAQQLSELMKATAAQMNRMRAVAGSGSVDAAELKHYRAIDATFSNVVPLVNVRKGLRKSGAGQKSSDGETESQQCG